MHRHRHPQPRPDFPPATHGGPPPPFMRPPARFDPRGHHGSGQAFPCPPMQRPPGHHLDIARPPPPFHPPRGNPNWNPRGPQPSNQQAPFNQMPPHPPPYQGHPHNSHPNHPPPPFPETNVRGPPLNHPRDFGFRGPPPIQQQGCGGEQTNPPANFQHHPGGPGNDQLYPLPAGQHHHQGYPDPNRVPQTIKSEEMQPQFNQSFRHPSDLKRSQEFKKPDISNPLMPTQWEDPGAINQDKFGTRVGENHRQGDFYGSRSRERGRIDAYDNQFNDLEDSKPKDLGRFQTRVHDDNYKKDASDFPSGGQTSPGSRDNNSRERSRTDQDRDVKGHIIDYKRTDRDGSRSHSQDRTGSGRESLTRYDRSRDGERDKSRDRIADRVRDRDRNRGRDRGRERDRDGNRERDRDRDRERERDRQGNWERDRGRNRDRGRERDRDMDKDRERERGRSRSPLRDGRMDRSERSTVSSRDENSRSQSRSDRDSSSNPSRESRPHSPAKEGRARTPTRAERRKRSPDAQGTPEVKDENKTSQGYNPSKPRERWNELERKLREEEEAQEQDLDLSLDPFDDLDQDDSTADDPPWVQCSPRENFLSMAPSDQINRSSFAATDKLKDLLGRFETDIVDRGPRARASQPEPEQKKPDLNWHVHSHDHSDSESSGSDSDSDSNTSSGEEDQEYDHRITCLENRANHPWRLTDNLWFNEPGEMNDGPLCKCSIKQQKSGIRHNIYPGEGPIPLCDPHTNNAARLHHYRVTISPTVNFLTPTQTVIVYDKREYIFEGFSLFSHHSLDEVPECKMVRFGREYTLHFFSEPMPEHFTVRGLDLFARFLFEEILELWDFDFKGKEGGCHHFHFMPRFARLLPSNGKELLSMHHVVQYLLRSSKPIIDPARLKDWLAVSEPTWQRYVDRLRHMIATQPGKKPSSIRIDQVDRDQRDPDKVTFPVIVHFGVRPAQLSYIRDPNYRKLLKSFTRLRHLLLNKPRVTNADKVKLAEKEASLQKMRVQNSRTREVTAEVSCLQMLTTGIGMDICQHALMLPVLVSHLRYFSCLTNMYKVLDYKFSDPMLLRFAMTHPSYKLYYGTNPDHVRNALYNCGIRFKQDFSESKKMLAKERKKGINQLYRIMSLMGSEDELPSHVKNYERLEFLGDAVIEFLSSTHLYHLFPDLEEGGLASYRVALVQNQHLSVLAKKLELDRYMLYAHGPDLCRPYDLRHAMANCLEAVMGALYLEAGLEHVRKFFGRLLFEEDRFNNIWLGHPKDPLQLDYPKTDRHLIKNSPILQKLTKFEDATGIKFRHIRLLARAFTQRTVGYTHLTRGSNQRLEFLGDSVLQLVVSTYLYKHFPDHHEGHLSLLRSSLVNNKIQSIVAQDLGLTDYIIDTKSRSKNDGNIPMKIMADLVEAFIGAVYVDRGLDIVDTFCSVVFFPRLKDFIMTQDWNDAKSQLQQCCLTLRVEGQEPDVPTYKVISQSGPTNSRQYLVAVYFRNKRMATGCASNIQDAQMEAAKNALKKGNFPHLWFQRKCVMLRRQRESAGISDRERRRGGRDDERRRGRRDDSDRRDERRETSRRGDRGRESEERRDRRGGERSRDERQEVTTDMRGLLLSNKAREKRNEDEERQEGEKKLNEKLTSDGQSERGERRSEREERRDHRSEREERSRDRTRSERERDRGRSDKGKDEGRSDSSRPERSQWRDDSRNRSSSSQRRERGRSPERRRNSNNSMTERRERQPSDRSSYDRQSRRDDARREEDKKEEEQGR